MPSEVVEVEVCLLKRTVRFVRPALKVVMQNDRHFVDVILLTFLIK
jgi:hypothetical protein